MSVPLVASPSGPLVRPDQMRPVVPITVSHLTGDRWLLIIGGASIEVEEGVRFARVGDAAFQLARAPEVRKGVLYVPLQLVVELVPRIAGNLAWDVERFELRAFSSTTRYEDRAVSQAGRASTPGPRDGVDDVASGERTTRGVPVAASATPRGPLRSRRLVVIDAGHGGPDPGMRGPIVGGPRVAEKNITLAVAKRVGAALGQRGIDVKFTRTTDTLIALSDRGRIANEAHADLFVSIHVNAANPGWKNPGAARGFETYFLAEAKTEDARRVEQMENEVVKFETRAEARVGDPLSFILNDMAQNEHLRESNELAELIQRRLGRVHPGPSRGVKQAGFRVLRHRVHAGGARRDRLRHERQRGLVHDRSESDGGAVGRRRRRRPRVPQALRAARRVGHRCRLSRGRGPAVTAGRSALQVQAAGLTFQNPIVLAAGTAAYGHELNDVVDLAALGGIVTKAVSPEPREGAPSPRVAEFGGGMINAVGLANPGVAAVRAEHLPWLARELPAVRKLANIVGFAVEEFAAVIEQLELSLAAEAPGALDGFELNVSCPNVKAGGMEFGADPEALRQVVARARAATRRPLFVKLSPSLPDIARTAQIAIDAGADGLTLVNTIPGLVIDVERRRPALGFGTRWRERHGAPPGRRAGHVRRCAAR